MSLKEYLKDNLRYFILWLLMLGIIDFFLIMFKITSSLIWIITIVILSSMIIIYGYDYYRKRREEGKPHWVALSHVARKLIRIIFFLEKNNIDYDSKKMR